MREACEHLAVDEELDPVGKRNDDVAVFVGFAHADHRVESIDRVRPVAAVKGAALDIDPGEHAVAPARPSASSHRDVAEDL